MKKSILFIAAVIALTSCGKIKRLTATEDTYSKTVERTDSIETVKTSEKVDTVVFLEPIKYDVSAHLLDLVDSSYILLDTPEVEITVKLDTVTKVLRASTKVKARKVAVKVDKQTETYSRSKTAFKSIQKDDVKVTEITKPKSNWWIYLIIGLVIVGGYLFFRFLPFRIVRK